MWLFNVCFYYGSIFGIMNSCSHSSFNWRRNKVFSHYEKMCTIVSIEHLAPNLMKSKVYIVTDKFGYGEP
jgi:hypothetical protein